MERGILYGLAAYRWLAWAWMATVLLLSRSTLVRPAVAYALAGLALAVTVALTATSRARPSLLTHPLPVAVEVAAGVVLVAADGIVHPPGHVFSVAQPLGVAWPLAGVLTAAVAGGPRAGAAAGVAMGAARAAAASLNGAGDLRPEELLSLASTVVLYLLAGAVGGSVMTLLRRAEREVASARAREEVARTLHDGVLQTLAIIERRSPDAAVARLAREQERALREWMLGVNAGPVDLEAGLRRAAARYEDAFGGRVDVVVADDLPPCDGARTEALVGAVQEALQNAGKHGSARSVTVFVEPDGPGGVFCSVKDDGTGFDPSTTPPGMGIDGSIRGRITEAGGRVEISSRPGGPTEVLLWL